VNPQATTVFEDRLRVLKHDELFAIFDRFGDIETVESGAQGLYRGDTRFLSRFELLIAGRRPVLLSSTVADDNALLRVDLASPTQRAMGGASVPVEAAHMLRTKFLLDDTCFESIRISNYARQADELELAFEIAADFADIFEVRGVRRLRRGELLAPTFSDDAVEYRYAGADARLRVARLTFSPAPDTLDGRGARYRIHVPPHSDWELRITIQCRESAADREVLLERPTPYPIALETLSHELAHERARWASLSSGNDLFDAWLARSFEDLNMLTSRTPQGRYPYAGTPWFSAAFGRDGLVTALECLWLAPQLARGVLEYLAATQATAHERDRDAEPGKILHETRHGEMAALREVPFGRYYGSVDATPLFVYLAGVYYEHTGDRQLLVELWPAVERALHWIEHEGDRDGDGFVEYGTTAEGGLVHQGWKDSGDAVFHADGTLVEPPVALCEVQAYVYGAWKKAVVMARALGATDLAASYELRARALHKQFERDFWCEELGTYYLALDGRKQPCRVRTSNAGHCLLTGIASPRRARLVTRQLLGEDLYSGWGIRTLARQEVRYSPLSYHNGSVWPHDNALVAMGMSRYGMQREASVVFTGMYQAATAMDLHRLPELFCGFPRRAGQGPTLYPVACNPQAWAAGAPYMLLRACLGIVIDAQRHTVELRNPVMPAFLRELHLQRLPVADATVDLIVRRHGHGVSVDVEGRHGQVRVSILK
jgi:glycogen debranching enzyme